MQQYGLSGDTILINQDHIIKICETDQSRFLKNIEKQKAFSNPHISSIPITHQGLRAGKNYIEMPYIRSPNSIVWMSSASMEEITRVIETLKCYFAHILNTSQQSKFDYESWRSKIASTKTKVTNPEILEILDHLVQYQFTQDFYYGDYHGDFTFSNLFILEDEILTFDFLDTYLHSPLNDLVKLRQDTKHLYSLSLMNSHSLDRNKVIMILHHIDQEIEKIILADESLTEYYGPLQLLNLIRILPYSKDSCITSYLVQEVKDLFHVLYPHYSLRW